MSYKLKKVQVTLSSGSVVTADIESIEDLKKLLKDLEHLGVEPVEPHQRKRQVDRDATETTSDETPEAHVEIRASLSKGSLRAKQILAFKGGVPQLLRPNAFDSVSDASVVLLFAVEAGLKKNSLEFDAFKGLYESQNIKSGSPVSMLLTNLRNAKYLDSKLYASERKVRLTAKGETKAIEVLKGLVEK